MEIKKWNDSIPWDCNHPDYETGQYTFFCCFLIKRT